MERVSAFTPQKELEQPSPVKRCIQTGKASSRNSMPHKQVRKSFGGWHHEVLRWCATLKKAALDAGVKIMFLYTRPHRCQPGSDRCGIIRGLRAQSGRLPELSSNAVAKIPLKYYSLIKPSFFNWPHRKPCCWGLRALDANHNGSRHGILTQKPQTSLNDFL